VVSRQQALDVGYTREAIAWRLESRRWQQLYKGVYATFTGPVPRAAWLRAATLRAGPGAVLSYRTAAELHGLTDPPEDEDDPASSIHVTVPSTRRVEVPGIIVHISGRAAEAAQPNREPPRTTVEETVLDLTQVARTFDQVCGWITRACGRGRTTEDKLRAALARRKKVAFRAEIDDCLAAAGIGVHSVLEYHYLADVERAHGLPASLHQVRVELDGKSTYRDVYYAEYLAVVELDGRTAHPDEQRGKDNHRDVVASAQGIQTSRYKWSDIDQHACETAVLQAKVLRERGWQGVPVPCGTGCPVAVAFPAATVSKRSGRFLRRRRRTGRARRQPSWAARNTARVPHDGAQAAS
jgi:predicted transcriptional regulator of viral defense system